ncbi:hypothetical protein JZ751_006521 [Albula glossodonta]|uniref:Uncharacterized protein n=1 Tax=Albula glossodonta TaxID=121402 RepID=A0A8T2NAQ6_9TELE|nr:hypothetical protein JZ751_006521 [Albula glossodonta]
MASVAMVTLAWRLCSQWHDCGMAAQLTLGDQGARPPPAAITLRTRLPRYLRLLSSRRTKPHVTLSELRACDRPSTPLR